MDHLIPDVLPEWRLGWAWPVLRGANRAASEIGVGDSRGNSSSCPPEVRECLSCREGKSKGQVGVPVALSTSPTQPVTDLTAVVGDCQPLLHDSQDYLKVHWQRRLLSVSNKQLPLTPVHRNAGVQLGVACTCAS